MNREEIYKEDSIFRRIYLGVLDLFSSNKKISSHFFTIAKNAEDHVRQALEVSAITKDYKLKIDMRIAAVLHNANNPKYFKEDNIKYLLDGVELSLRRKRRIRKMIDLVFQFNDKITIPQKYFQNDVDGNCKIYLLYPHFAVRIEYLGKLGLLKSYLFSIEKNLPLSTSKTPKVKTLSEINEQIKMERFSRYKIKKTSESFIDNLYDYTLQLSQIETKNTYFTSLLSEKKDYIDQFLISFGKTGRIKLAVLYSLKNKYKGVV